MELISTTAVLIAGAAVGWGVGRKRSPEPVEAAPSAPTISQANDPEVSSSVGSLSGRTLTGGTLSGGTLSGGTDPAAATDSLHELRKQLEAARIAAYSARHSLSTAKEEAAQLRAALDASQARYDEEVARARIAERMHTASRRAREEALEQRASMDDALQRTQTRVGELEAQIRRYKEGASPEVAELATAVEALRAENLALRAELAGANGALAAATADRDAAHEQLAAARVELAAVHEALTIAQEDLAVAHEDLATRTGGLSADEAEAWERAVHELEVERDAALADRDSALADLAAVQGEAAELRARIYRAPGR